MKTGTVIFLALFMAALNFQISEAHQDGCHRWHSCSSDTGSYVCGDKGYCSECLDNEYCSGGLPIKKSSSSTSNWSSIKNYTTYESTTSNTQTNKTTTSTLNNTNIQTSQNTANTSCKGNALCMHSTVKRVIDGDTIEIESNQRIRLSLVNTPEKNRGGFREATLFTENLCKVGSEVVIDQDDLQLQDKYSRILGIVYCNDKNLNKELLDNKHAIVWKRYCKVSEFRNESWALNFGCKDRLGIFVSDIANIFGFVY